MRTLTKEHGIFLIVDEVQTGVGATGTFWAHEKWNLDSPPDFVTFSFVLSSFALRELILESLQQEDAGSRVLPRPLDPRIPPLPKVRLVTHPALPADSRTATTRGWETPYAPSRPAR